jgi:hypothetical protein
MSTQEIPRAEWNNFFDGFSRQHEGWLATLEVFAPDVGAQEEAHELPLEGISIASSDENPNSISISLGRSPANHVTHTINEPEHVWVDQTSRGANAALEIESQNDTRTLLRFRSSVPTEMVDAVETPLE